MIRESEGFATTAADVIAQADTPPSGLEDLKSLASTCSACDLPLPATQTVFGEGPMDARLVFVGEQPGDQEDIAGRPFVGPAGQVLNDAFAAAEIDRDRVYLTNMVKHFKHQVTQTLRGKKRLHQRPDAREVRCLLGCHFRSVNPWSKFSAEQAAWRNYRIRFLPANHRDLASVGNPASRRSKGEPRKISATRK
jgi:hypothetical protein